MDGQHAHSLAIAHDGRGKIHKTLRFAAGAGRQQLGQQLGRVDIAHVYAAQTGTEPGALFDVLPHQQVAGGRAHHAIQVGHAYPQAVRVCGLAARHDLLHQWRLQALRPQGRGLRQHLHLAAALLQAVGQHFGGIARRQL